MDVTTRRVVADALDAALAGVAWDEMIHIWDDSVATNNGVAVENALFSLASLRRGSIPQYDDRWVALLYASWYQPSHINMAYSMITSAAHGWDLDRARLTDSGELHIVDFGCGALAMQFGICLAVADALERGQSIRKVRVDSIDSSQPMIDIGLKIWRQFKNSIVQDEKVNSLSYINQAIQVMEIIAHTNADCEVIRQSVGEDAWISALHTVYPANIMAVKNALSSIFQTIRPTKGFITSHRANARFANSVSPLSDDKYRLQEMKNIRPQFAPPFNMVLPKMTKWREQLRDIILSPNMSGKIADQAFIRQYLGNSVTWPWANQYDDTRFLIYAKR